MRKMNENVPHNRPEKHISQLLPGSCDLHGSETTTSEKTSPSAPLMAILFNTFTEGLRNWREEWREGKTKAHRKILGHTEIHRSICQKFNKGRLPPKKTTTLLCYSTFAYQSRCREFLLGKIVAINPKLLIQKEPHFSYLT